MACGVHLGLFLIFLVQAEHVRCLWATQAPGSQRQNGNKYVGFSQQDSGLRLAGSYLQNQFRQASVAPGSALSSSLNTETGYSQGLSSSGYTQTVSQPTQSGYSSVRLVQSSSMSNPNWRTTSLNRLNAQKVPKKQFGLSTAIASGSSVHKLGPKKLNEPISNSRTWPVQQGTQRTNQHLSSRSASVQSPSRESYSTSASHHYAAQKPPSAVAAPAYYRQSSAMLNQKHSPRGLSPKSSRLFSPRAPAPQRNSVQMRTSASAPARRVSARRRSEKPSSFSSRSEITRHNPSQAEAGNPYQSKPTFNMASSRVSSSQSLPALTYQQGAPVGSQQPHSLKAPTSSRAGSSAQRFAPTKTYSIPQRFGGFAIRRLREPDQRETSIQKPQQTYTVPPRQTYTVPPRQAYTVPPRQAYTVPPQQPASSKPQAQRVHQKSEWKRIRPHLGQLTGAAGVLG